jgi:hypothetical protein
MGLPMAEQGKNCSRAKSFAAIDAVIHLSISFR